MIYIATDEGNLRPGPPCEAARRRFHGRIHWRHQLETVVPAGPEPLIDMRLSTVAGLRG
jgi:hypothetical protein